jgi:hypothetical protein
VAQFQSTAEETARKTHAPSKLAAICFTYKMRNRRYGESHGIRSIAVAQPGFSESPNFAEKVVLLHVRISHLFFLSQQQRYMVKLPKLRQ